MGDLCPVWIVYVIGSVISTLILTHSGTLPGSSSATMYIENWNIRFGAADQSKILLHLNNI